MCKPIVPQGAKSTTSPKKRRAVALFQRAQSRLDYYYATNLHPETARIHRHSGFMPSLSISADHWEFVHEIGAKILGRPAHDGNVKVRQVFLNIRLQAKRGLFN
jgi:hypothetical protein